jgi:hemerythrin
MLIAWNNNLSTGINRLDEQHRDIFNKINVLFEVIKRNKSKDEVLKSLIFLDEYTKQHFMLEEDLQATHEYPSLKQHKLLHEKFIADYEKYRKLYEQNGATDYFLSEFDRWLVEWWISHITKVDMMMCVYLKSKMSQADIVL